MKLIQINLKVKGLRTDKQREEFGQAVAEHLLESFNDDGSITQAYHQVVEFDASIL